MNPALWAETFADDEDFSDTGFQPGEEVQLFASDEAGQLTKARLVSYKGTPNSGIVPTNY